MKNAATLTMLTLVLSVAGCATDVDEQGLPQGLTILDVEPGSLSVAYRRGDLVVYAEALRGQAVPEAYRNDPLSPQFEVDSRFMSADGYIFYTQQGGDLWLDPSWADARAVQTELPPTRESNEWMFELAEELSAALPAALEAELGADAAEYGPEVTAIVTFGNRASEAFADMQALVREDLEADARRAEQGIEERAIPVIEGEAGGEIAYGDIGGPDAGSTSWGANRYYMSHHVGSIDFAWWCGGYHSATRLWEVRNGTWAAAHDNANHGRGPYGDGMYGNGHIGAYNKPAWTLRTCSTGYDMLSNGSGHNCHDDARIQMINLGIGANVGGSQYFCNDGDSGTDFSCGNEAGHPYPRSSKGEQDGAQGYSYPSTCQYNFNGSCPSSYQGTNDGCDCGCVFPDGSTGDPDCRARY